MNNFEIFLQLHAEGEGSYGGDYAPSTESSADYSDTSSSSDSGGESTQGEKTITSVNSDTGNYALTHDERTGRTLVRIDRGTQPSQQNEGNPAQHMPSEEPTMGQGAFIPSTPIQVPQPNYYDASELTLAIQTNTVDETRVPPAFQQQYAAAKAMAMQNQAVQAQQLRQQNEEADAERIRQENKARSDFYAKIEESAREHAMAELNLTEDDVENGEYSDDDDLRERVQQFNTSLAWHRTQIMDAVKTEQARQANLNNQIQARFNSINSFVEQERSNEPNFQNINVKMLSYFKELPYEKAAPIAEAIEAYKGGSLNDAQLEILHKYYNDTKLAFYAQSNGLKTYPNKATGKKVPVVEGSGNGASGGGQYTLNDLGQAKNYKDRASIVASLVRSIRGNR